MKSRILCLTSLFCLAVCAACGGGAPAEQETTVEPTVEPVARVEAPEPAPVAPVARATAPTPAPRKAARPAPAPRPEPVMVELPAGTQLQAVLLGDLVSGTSQVGDQVQARLTQDVVQAGAPVIPAGSVVTGEVIESRSVEDKKIGGKARVSVQFHTVELTSGRSAEISALYVETGKSETKKDAATIGGATVGGAILGRAIESDDEAKGTLIGAVVGAAAGTAIAAKTKGKELELVRGTELTLEFDQPATIAMLP